MAQALTDPTLPQCIVPAGSFNIQSTFDYLFQEPEIIHSLDVLSSNIVPFKDPSNPWVTALTLYHYTSKGERQKYNTERAIVLTLADLFCDEVPESSRSRNPHDELIASAQSYIKSMDVLQPIWSEITVKEYAAALETYPTWPIIHDPTVDTYGSSVDIGNLMQAWAFCFKKPSPEAIRKLRSGLWGIVVGFAHHGMITHRSLRSAVDNITERLGPNVSITDSLKSLIGNHILSLISNDGLKRILSDNILVNQLSIIKIITEDRWEQRCAVRILVRALKQYFDFPWEKLDSLDRGVQIFHGLLKGLRFHRSSMYLKHVADSEPNTPCVSRSMPTLHYCAYVAKELFIRIAGHNASNYAWKRFTPDFGSSPQFVKLREKMDNMIEEYVKNRTASGITPTPEQLAMINAIPSGF